jgi:hypothetical protein
MRLVTLLAIADLGCACVNSMEAEGETSSTGEALPAETEGAALARVEELFLPKLSFHFDGFFVPSVGERGAVTRGAGGRALRSAVGIA